MKTIRISDYQGRKININCHQNLVAKAAEISSFIGVKFGVAQAQKLVSAFPFEKKLTLSTYSYILDRVMMCCYAASFRRPSGACDVRNRQLFKLILTTIDD